MKKDQTRKVYFPGLNALRFFAAFAVIITHVELMKKYLGFNNSWSDVWNDVTGTSYMPIISILEGSFKWYHPLVVEAGPLGVVFFFVLSGFLITYLLFVEKMERGSIKVKAFYTRRIFRIWPLYYLLFILGFFVLPQFEWFHAGNQQNALEEPFWVNFWCYLLILPNLALSLLGTSAGSVPNIGQSWSIGVEEQFYIIWPWIIKKARRPLLVILGFTAFLMLLKVSVLFAIEFYPSDGLLVFKNFLVMSKIECMTIGGLGAHALYFQKDKVLKFVYQKWVQWAALISIPVLLFFTHRIFQNAVHLAYAVAFLIIIINVSCNENSILKLENKALNFLGRISYGVYMYHILVIVFLLNMVKHYSPEPDTLDGWKGLVFYILAAGVTILISHLSYTYFESYFIRLKKKYTRVVSGEEAKN